MTIFDVKSLVQEANRFSAFNPVQLLALEKGVLERSLIVASPTASGKTVIAEMGALHSILNEHQKVIYTCPLKALASEHYHDWKKKFAPLKIRMAIATGDFDSSSAYLDRYDLIFTTMEKLDSLLRHRAEWLGHVGLLIVDELHTLGSDRGPALEMAITKLRLVSSSLRILGLSATIPNAAQLAAWLNANLVESNYRPVRLEEGVLVENEIRFSKRMESLEKKVKEPVQNLVHDTVAAKKKQCLVFANSRSKSEAMAEKLSSLVFPLLQPREQQVLERVSEKIRFALEQPTPQCEKAANLVKKGIAFHHAGLVEKQRRWIERAFRKNWIKIISCTPTLAAGVNTPAFRVIIPSVYRYDGSWGGSSKISVAEYKQMSGRAGRPQFDERGESVLIASSETEAEELEAFFIRGEIEEIESQLSREPVLRTHLLAAIASGFVFDLDSLESFFSKTFFAHQYQKTDALFSQLNTILTELFELGFVTGDEKRFDATPLGKRVAELYLDPLAAHQLIVALRENRLFSPLTYLFLFVQTGELFPLVTIPKKKEPAVLGELMEAKDELPIRIERELYADPELARKFATARLLEEWINEKPDAILMEDFNTAPGLLRSKLLVCDWLAYASFELCQLLQLEKHIEKLGKLRKRIQHGVKEELLELVEVRGIGRVRARRLWNANLRTINQLKQIDRVDLARILGEKVAFQVKENVGQTNKTVRQERLA